jgi:UDP-2-acetamido-2-deoxy-ribo-hexuluronate aminotransferase
MDLLLDVNIAVDVSVKREPFYQLADLAIAKCLHEQGRIWLYAGSVQTIEYVARNELKRQNEKRGLTLTARQLAKQTRDLLKAFAADKHWLAALAGEGPVFDSPDPEDEQLIGALDRFPTGAIKLLTRDEPPCDRYPDRTITPDQYLQTPPRQKGIDFIDLKRQQDFIRPELEAGIHRVLHHGQYIMGPEVRKLEENLAGFTGSAHAITCASGTDALLIALMALDIGPGDEVVTVPYTWISTAEVIALLNAKPVFVDIRPDTFNMDPDSIEAAITDKTKAIMPVSIYGQCADMTRINAIAEKHGLPVIEDGAQSFGATHHGKKSCALSLIGCTSFFPSKPLGCYGDGGAIFTDDDALAEKMRQIRVHGQKVKHQHPLVGINGRLDTMQATVLLEKLAIFPEECRLRWEAGQRYDALLSGIDGVQTPLIGEGNDSVYAQYTILVEDRDRLSQGLKDSGVPSVAYYTAPLHLQGAFAELGYGRGDFPVSEDIAARCLSLPMSPYLSEKHQKHIGSAIKME